VNATILKKWCKKANQACKKFKTKIL